MQAVVKTHHIRINVEGDIIPLKILNFLKKEFGDDLKVTEKKNKKELRAEETDWYKKVKEEISPGDNLKIYRLNKNLSQGQLAKLLEIHPVHVSEMERGKRGISKEMAKKLSRILEARLEKFI